jgi:hypothetical protein
MTYFTRALAVISIGIIAATGGSHAQSAATPQSSQATLDASFFS